MLFGFSNGDEKLTAAALNAQVGNKLTRHKTQVKHSRGIKRENDTCESAQKQLKYENNSTDLADCLILFGGLAPKLL